MRAWQHRPSATLLDDGHVEIGHDCTDGRVTGILPMPPWRVTQVRPYLAVEPSVNCEACGMHSWVGGPEWELSGG